jgi:hypothetical protein
MRKVILGPLKGGITRLRIKGGANAKELYDLLNGYVDVSGSARARPGSDLVYTLPQGTSGMVYFDGNIHVFSTTLITGAPVGVVIDVLHNPAILFTGTITRIHFAKPFLGVLYVVAEFSDGSVYHYWLQNSSPWQANHAYLPHTNASEVPASPSVPNGFKYEPSPVLPEPDKWVANTPRAVGDEIIPTDGFVASNPQAGDFKQVVTEVIGSTPASGAVEPSWQTTIGGITYEYYESGETPSGSTTGSGGWNGNVGSNPDAPGGSRYLLP